MNRPSPAPFWVATGNPAKAKELVGFAAEYFPICSPIIAREPKGVVEDEPTFGGNAALKAHALVRELIDEGQRSFLVLGDYSGLSVDLLNGSPGVLSARYSSPNPSPQKNVEKLLRELEKITTDLPKRTGKYICALHLVQVSEGEIIGEFMADGDCEGLIALEPKGSNGYAYDNVFLDPQSLVSYGEVSYAEKQKNSHRRRAFDKLKSLAEGV